MKTIKSILFYILLFVISFSFINVVNVLICIYLNEYIKNAHVVSTLFIVMYFGCFLLVYGPTYKSLYYNSGEINKEMLMLIRRNFFSFDYTIDVIDKEDASNIIQKVLRNKKYIKIETSNKRHINCIYFIYKMKKMPYLLKNEDFINILRIIRSDVILEKYFISDLRAEKLKKLFDEQVL